MHVGGGGGGGGGGLTSIDPPDLHICCNLMKLTSLLQLLTSCKKPVKLTSWKTSVAFVAVQKHDEAITLDT